MRPISELTFGDGIVLLVFTNRSVAVGSLCLDGNVRLVYSADSVWPVGFFTHFLPLSEIEQLKELPR